MEEGRWGREGGGGSGGNGKIEETMIGTERCSEECTGHVDGERVASNHLLIYMDVFHEVMHAVLHCFL